MEDFIGKTFGMLTVTGEFKSGAPKYKSRLWQVRCSCGGETWVPKSSLVHGLTKSCGCLRRNATAKRFSKTAPDVTLTGNTPHTRTPTYAAWAAMKDRCLNPTHKMYKYYGGRGITICDRWMSFHNFIADMGERPDGLTLEREDNMLGYTPSNCVWADWSAQMKNRRSWKRKK